MGRSTRNPRRRSRRKDKKLGINPPPTSYGQVTVPGNYAWAGWDYREITKRSDISYDELQLMVDIDGHARSLYNILRRPILRNAKRAEILPPVGGGGEAETEFIRSNYFDPVHLGGMQIPFTKACAHMTTAFLFGFKAFEKMWYRPSESPAGDGLIRLRKLSPIDARTVKFRVTENGDFDGFRQVASWKGRLIDRNVDVARAAYFNIDDEEEPFYGKSLFGPAYYHFDKKHKIYYMLHLALSVGAIPPRIATSKGSASDKDRQTFLKALGDLGANSAMLMPQGFELLDKPEFKPVTGLPFIEAIDHQNLEMSKSIVAQALDIGTGQQGGGFSVGKIHMDAFFMTLEGIQDSMAVMWDNQITPELITWNFGSRKFPRVYLPPFTAEHRDLLTDVFKILNVARETKVSPEFMASIEKDMAKELGFSINDVDIDEHAVEIALRQELDSAADRASKAIGEDARSKTAAELLENPRFVKWAESYAGRYRQRLLELGVIKHKDEDEQMRELVASLTGG